MSISDDFNRADSTTNLGSTSTGSVPWVQWGGTWGIGGSKAYVSSGRAGSTQYAVVDSGVAVCTVSAVITRTTGTNINAGLIVRGSSISDFLLVEIGVGFSYAPKVYKVVAGTATTIATGSAVTFASGDTLSVEVTATTIVAKRNGTTIVSVTDSTHASNTMQGLYQVAATGAVSTGRHDDFAVDSATTGAGAATAPVATASGAGLTTIPGAAAVSSPKATAAGAGTSTVTGSGAVTGPVASASGTGLSDDTTFGEGAVTSPAATGSGSGTSTATGVGAVASPAATGSGAGTSTVIGSGAAIAPLATAAGEGAGGSDPIGSGAAIAPAANASGAGFVDVEGVVTVEFVVTVDVEVSVGLTPADELAGSEVILRESFVMPAITEADPVYTARVDYPVVTDVIGTVHLWIGGVDVTYFRGVPTKVLRWDAEAPFGDKSAAWEMPGMMPWERPGVGDFAFMRKDAEVVIGYVSELGVVRREWEGFYDSRTRNLGDNRSSVFEAKGEMWAALHKVHEPTPYMEPTDIGVVIPRLLNNVRGRRYPRIPEVSTGIKTRTRGARDQWVWQVVQDIFAEAWTDDGRQWTLRKINGAPQMVLKTAMTEVAATVAWGTPLVDIDLTVDDASRVDIMYARGKSPGGGEWANVFYPGLAYITPPPFPNDPVVNINVGTVDADTDTGTGVSDWQRKVNSLGRWERLAVDGAFGTKDSAVLREVQDDLGLTVDGSLGPQSWEGTFGSGREAIDLTPVRLPLVYRNAAYGLVHDSHGRVTGTHPTYDPSIVPHEIALDMGTNITRSQARKACKTYIAVHGSAAATGSVEFIGDPNGTDRTRLQVGDNLNITGIEGRDVVVQLAGKSCELDGDSDGRSLIVRFTFDERARDALTVDQILERNRAALPDPARRPGSPNRQSRNVRDEGYTWDEESPCGEIERVAVNGVSGLWTTRVVPVAEFGTLASIILDSDYPFAMAVFANTRITPNVLRRLVGNPFATTNPFEPNMTELEDVWGLVEAWGQEGDACGYGNTTEANGGAFTGKFEFKNPLDYVTDGLPYLTFAFYMRGGSGFIDGRARPTKDAG